jgi:hypothetical protein
MSLEATFERLLTMMVRRGLTVSVTDGTVVAGSVDKSENTCDVERFEQPILHKCRLHSVIGSAEKTMVVYPNEGANVLVVLVNNSPTDGYVVACDDIDEVVFMNGENGGLTITPKLVEELGKTNQLLTGLIDIINGTQITEPGNGSPSALQAALKGAITGKALGDYSEIENEKIKH